MVRQRVRCEVGGGVEHRHPPALSKREAKLHGAQDRKHMLERLG